MSTMSSTVVPSTPYASASLYVGDLAPEVTEALLFEIFSAVGAVASVRVCRDAATRRSLGYAYINFHRVEDAERALDTMNFSQIRGKACRIMWSHRDPSLRKSGLGNIFVKNLAKTIDNKSLFDTFSVFGNILSCKVATNSKRESLGYGFVHYESDEAANNAIHRVNGMVIAGEKVQVATFKSKKERGGADKSKFTNVYVKNLPEDFTKNKLVDLFGKYGEITSAFLAEEKEGKCKGFGFVNFKTPEQASAAVEALDNKLKLTDKPLVVCRAQKKEEREKELREKFEQSKLERQKKYAGVNLYIKNLSDNIEDDRLNHEFVRFGNITSAKVMKDQNKKSRGFGFVCFSTPDEATKAVTEMNGHMVDGKPLYVALAQRKDVRRAQLEAQHAQRAKLAMGGVPQPPMYPPQGTPHMYYGGVPQIQGNFYPPQMVRRPWNPPQQPMMGVRPHQPYQLLPMNGGSGGVSGQQQRTQGPPNQTGGRGRARGRGGNTGGPKNGQVNQIQQGQNNGRRGGGNAGQSTTFKYTANARNQPMPQPHSQQQPQVPQQQPQQSQTAISEQVSGNVDEGTNADSSQAASLNVKALTSAPEEQRKQMLGERLFPLIAQREPQLAGKITGMLLEMDNTELLNLLDSESALQDKINEALTVLNSASEHEEP